MVSDIEILRKMLKTEVTVLPNEKEAIILEEADYSVIINNWSICEEFIVIKADAFELPRNFFNNANDQFKRADFIIIAETAKNKVIICIEMKATSDHENKIIAQLKGAQCLVEYCRALGKAFWHSRDFLAGYNYHFVSMGHIKNGAKPKYTPAEIKFHNPKMMLKIIGERRIAFNKLLSQLV